MLGMCSGCYRRNIEIHPIKTEDNSGIYSIMVCETCDEFSQGILSEAKWEELTKKDTAAIRNDMQL